MGATKTIHVFNTSWSAKFFSMLNVQH